MLTEIEKNRLEKVAHSLIRGAGAYDIQTWDIKAEIDSNLKFSENVELIKEKISQRYPRTIEYSIGTLKKDIDTLKEKENFEEKQEFIEIENKTKKEFDKEIEGIINNKISKLDKYFEPLKNYIKAVATSKGYLNSLFICSRGGLGKSTILLKTLKEVGVDYKYTNNYSTCVELVNFLFQNKDKQIVFDDIESMFKMGEKVINIFKGALWGIGKNNKRIISYLTTDKRLKAPSQFEFEGKIYFVLNEMPRENPLIKALLSRSLIYELNFTYAEMLKILAEFIKIPYKKLKIDERKEIYNYLVEISDVDCEDMNFRTLIKMYDIFISDKINWKEMSKNLIKRDEKMYILRKCLREENSVKNARIRFCEETGYSFRHFFNLKNKLMQ